MMREGGIQVIEGILYDNTLKTPVQSEVKPSGTCFYPINPD